MEGRGTGDGGALSPPALIIAKGRYNVGVIKFGAGVNRPSERSTTQERPSLRLEDGRNGGAGLLGAWRRRRRRQKRFGIQWMLSLRTVVARFAAASPATNGRRRRFVCPTKPSSYRAERRRPAEVALEALRAPAAVDAKAQHRQRFAALSQSPCRSGGRSPSPLPPCESGMCQASAAAAAAVAAGKGHQEADGPERRRRRRR